ncbi:MAG: membrane protein insertion efficiency factor YidD [Chloroflexi bacterium]|nr:membrane protein insertion efficiency factor YidD [Chloroflexota bacterium]MYF78439.1 membrane protein insertion efficiency factor YidD [Chloroflexota bacterium]MYK61084.1 membrane protein insertion efficiency factor YidD [Chloroflexota bacterium]
MAKSALALIKFYKLAVSPYLPSTCIYQPTCSEYAAEAIEQHGVVRGIWMGIKRIARCNPFTTGGLDPVPVRNEGSGSATRTNETHVR